MKMGIGEIYSLEALSENNTCIHKLHPRVKLLCAFIFIVIVVSYGRYDFLGLVPCVLYTTVVMALAEVPFSMLLKRYLVALPFCFLAGIANVFIDRAPVITIGSVTITAGIISLATILLRSYLCVVAVLLLVATTCFTDITNQLRKFHVPEIIVEVFEMIYRYIAVLVTDAKSMYHAYVLRSVKKNGIDIRHMGSFVGYLVIKSFDNAQRVHSAMIVRGYGRSGPIHLRMVRKMTVGDWLYLVLVPIVLLALRIVHPL
ncbi:MAG: cobalt ECF transporter T component CbiQ [Clostridiales Family XIII bacterium]|jgi:cobalt/nickel transport system permease protein|nr:cobalt ECF transporter T component CbiQ [Clostridiales Family XIII bacterium]